MQVTVSPCLLSHTFLQRQKGALRCLWLRNTSHVNFRGAPGRNTPSVETKPQTHSIFPISWACTGLVLPRDSQLPLLHPVLHKTTFPPPPPPTPSLLHQRHKRDTWNQRVCRCLCLGSCAWGSFERSLAFTQDPGPAVHFLWRLSKFPYSFSHSLSTAHLQTPASTTGSSGGFQSPIRLMSLCITQDTSPEQLFPMEIGINKGTALSEKHPGPNPVLGNGFKITRAHSTRLAKPVLPVSN